MPLKTCQRIPYVDEGYTKGASCHTLSRQSENNMSQKTMTQMRKEKKKDRIPRHMNPLIMDAPQ